MTNTRTIAVRRSLAFALDWLVVVLWGGMLFGAFSGEGGFPAWVWGPAAVALVGPVWWLVAMFATGRTPYDRWTSARVARSTGPEHRSEATALAAQQPVAADGAQRRR
jgi:hypothetical protein